jgi:hypothetical protein
MCINLFVEILNIYSEGVSSEMTVVLTNDLKAKKKRSANFGPLNIEIEM